MTQTPSAAPEATTAAVPGLPLFYRNPMLLRVHEQLSIVPLLVLR